MNARARLRTRLLTRDVAATAAFASMAVSGELPIWSVAIFAASLLIALTGRRPLSGHGTASAVALLFAAIGLYFSVATGRFDLVIAASSFAGLITAQRMLAEPIPATDNQVHLTSLLMISGGAALSGDLLFGFCLAVFALNIALSLGLSVLDGGGRDQAEVKVRTALGQIGAGATFAVIGGLLFFALFPRLSWNVAARRMSRGLGGNTAGLATRIQLGATGGSIKTTARVVARVKLAPDPEKASLDRYFVASHFSQFDGRSWDGPTDREAPKQSLNFAGQKPDLLVQKYELLPGFGQPIAIALEQPVGFMHAVAMRGSGWTPNAGFIKVPGREVRIASEGNGYTYTAWSISQPVPPTEEELSASLELPANLNPEIKKLAQTIAGGETDPQKIAAKLEAHLQREFRYSLELPGAVDDPLSDFLFVRKEGHCEFFATALTVMLRALGVPARITVGFFGGVRNGEHYLIRAGDAHAWTEVHVPGKGFVRFDATPESGRRAQSAALSQLLTDAYERIEAWWSRAVIDYSLRDQVDFVRKLMPERSVSKAQNEADTSSLPSARRVIATLATGFVVFLLMRVLLSRTKRPTGHEATLLLVAIEKALLTARLEREENEDISEVARRLTEQQHPLAPVVSEAARRYLEARFGNRPLRDKELEHFARKLQARARATGAGRSASA